MQTKIGTEVAHVTRDSDTTFRIKRSKVNLQGAGAYCGGLQHSLFHAFLTGVSNWTANPQDDRSTTLLSRTITSGFANMLNYIMQHNTMITSVADMAATVAP